MKATRDIFLQFGPFVTAQPRRNWNSMVFATIDGANASSSTHSLALHRVLLITAKSFTVGVDVAGRGSSVAVLDRRAPSMSIRLSFYEASIWRRESMASRSQIAILPASPQHAGSDIAGVG